MGGLTTGKANAARGMSNQLLQALLLCTLRLKFNSRLKYKDSCSSSERSNAFRHRIGNRSLMLSIKRISDQEICLTMLSAFLNIPYSPRPSYKLFLMPRVVLPLCLSHLSHLSIAIPTLRWLPYPTQEKQEFAFHSLQEPCTPLS